MNITTTNGFDGITIREYKGMVFGEIIAANSLSANIANPFIGITGGRASAIENEFNTMRNTAVNEMIERAKNMGANAVVGVRVDVDELSDYIMVTASGTAVVI